MKAAPRPPAPRRMLAPAEAALYVGLPLKSFKALCPTAPVDLGGGKLWYDQRDLDGWIDTVKTNEASQTREQILGRL